MGILVVVLGALGLGFFLYNTQSKKESGSRTRFLAQGRDAGFSSKETEQLRQLAGGCGIEDPCSIFRSQEQLEKCIRTLVRSIKMSGEGEAQEVHDFLSRLYDFRKKLEANKPANKGITNSRQISEGQFLKVLVPENGVFTSHVIKNSSQTMTVSRPVNKKNISGISWSGAKISVYFWRENDAGYVFDTVVDDEVYSKGVAALKISHSDSLFRTQKRRSARLKMHKPAFLYLAIDGEESHKLETAPGLKCFLEDISDNGCAVTVGGKTEANLRVKVQFALGTQAICMTGTVRSTSFKEDANRSLLRIEADPLPQKTRNLILGEVFGTQDDSDDDLPFQELDEEAASIGAQNAHGRNVPASGVTEADFSTPNISDFSVKDIIKNDIKGDVKEDIKDDIFSDFGSPSGKSAVSGGFPV